MSFLARHFLSYAPIVNQQRVAIASRVTVRPAEGSMGQLSEAYETFSDQWSPDGGRCCWTWAGSNRTGAC
ncbi:MAG: hypothetical protein R3E68_08360 [Burkholderiaceae bacterium]